MWITKGHLDFIGLTHSFRFTNREGKVDPTIIMYLFSALDDEQ